ncbi:MAG: MFS transporter [Chloroflexi bacterium]|nr:MFS transporter [Chloroflexota bacterium]
MHHAEHPRTLVDRSPLFYGWVVWAVATVGMILTSPAQSFTTSLFIDQFIVEFDLSRTMVSSLYGLGTFIAALSLTFVGREIDLRGNRMSGVIISVLFATALLFMSIVTGPLMLLIGFILIRGLGYGAMVLVSTTSIAQWFFARRGRMMSFTLVAFSLFQVGFVPFLEELFTVYEWREIWLLMSVGVLVTGVPIFWGLMRNKPEDFGLNPDNMSDDQRRTGMIEQNWTLPQVRRTTMFWVFLAGRMAAPGFGTGLIIHQVSIFEAVGHSRATAAGTYALIALLSAGTALMIGYLLDKYRPGLIITTQLMALTASMFLAMTMTAIWMTVLYAVFFSIVLGTGTVFDGSVWANIFGREHLGAIRGFVSTALVISTSVGPVIFALSYDLFGSYDVILWIAISLTAIPMTLAPVVKLPAQKPGSQP